MSFGFSVGDFVAGAQLAYTLCKALSDGTGSAREFQELIAQLDIIHKVLLQVDQLRATNQLAQPTINALLFTVNAANETMESFLDQNQPYLDSLKVGGSGARGLDAYRKLKWPFQMTDRVKNLKRSLATMLSAVNCLVSLACYYNTGYNPRCTAELSTSDESEHPTYWGREHGGDIKITSQLLNFDGSPQTKDFKCQRDTASFFRAGQVFATEVSSTLYLNSDRRFEKVDFGHLPLEDVSKLKARAEEDHLKDRQKRLAQIRSLPLSQMTVHCEDVSCDRTRVECLLCNRRTFLKDDWTFHFQLNHWQYYFSMVPETAIKWLPKRWKEKVLPIDRTARPSLDFLFSTDSWITIEDVTKDVPIHTDQEVVGLVCHFSPHFHHLRGPIMIQRFVVISEGVDSCLCLGIHTYARKGCGGQPDQELFGVIHSSKEPPAPFSDEIRMNLPPIRMKPHHPSTTLPSSARIHFGRAYEVAYSLPVQPLGLVHPISMETLVDQFNANVCRRTTDDQQSQVGAGMEDSDEEVEVEELEHGVKIVDLETVKDMRSNITKVLGSNLSPADNQPLQLGGGDGWIETGTTNPSS